MQRSKNDLWVGLFVLIGAVAILFLALPTRCATAPSTGTFSPGRTRSASPTWTHEGSGFLHRFTECFGGGRIFLHPCALGGMNYGLVALGQKGGVVRRHIARAAVGDAAHERVGCDDQIGRAHV